MIFAVLAAFLLAVPGAGPPSAPTPRSLQEELVHGPSAALALESQRKGDPEHGALLFYQPYMACARCHDPSDGSRPLGPVLGRESHDRTPAELIEAVLEPSRSIARGFESVAVATRDGRAFTGLLAEDRPDALVIRDPSPDGRSVEVRKADVDERRDGGASVMPEGLANLLASRQEFLDLASYLIEVTAGGPARAIELKPSRWALTPAPLPPYERELDHAGLLASLDENSLRRGAAVYGRTCVTCHGTKDQPGSMPTSLRFASGTFRNGADPFSMYQTLTRGYGQMPAQSMLVPREKYDVIHYIRESVLRTDNPGQYVPTGPEYLARLPKGTARGPRPVVSEPWRETDYGPVMMLTLEVGRDSGNIACKGIAVRLDPGPGGIARGSRWVVYDHDTMRLAGAWTGSGFIDWNGINFNGRHEVHPATVGHVHLSNPDAPGWADPATGRFDDRRIRGRDGRPYGPLPRDWLRYRGLFRSGDRVVLSYTVGDASVLESPGAEDLPGGGLAFTRTLEIGRSTRDLALRVAPDSAHVAISGQPGLGLAREAGSLVVRVEAASTPVRFKVWTSERASVGELAEAAPPLDPLDPLTHGGPSRWPEQLSTRPEVGAEDGPLASDVLTPPEVNPWSCRFRLSGLDFLDGGRRAAVCSWDGDVWIVDGLDRPAGPLLWRRIAAGLFQPLGLKVVDGQVYVTCRDQIAILRDLDGDGETDFADCFNSDHQVTEHFHEFAMDLQRDSEGNFYYTKAARHARTALVPQHGTLLKVGRDGATTEVLATGFRAPNGVCLNPDGSFFISDQEGHWTPKNRINRVVQGGFHGNMWGYHDVTDPSDAAMVQPICWITNSFDRSPAELLWVRDRRWGALEGSLLSLSYGYGKLFVVPHETVAGQMQGGMCELPLRPFPTGVSRGRLNPADGQLYLCGLFGWGSNQEYPGGFYRVRPTGKPLSVPVRLHATTAGLEITFSDPLDPAVAADPSRYAVRTWGLKRSANYGSPHVDEAPLPVTAARLSADGRTVTLTLPGIRPTQCMQVAFSVQGAGGGPVEGRIHNTIHHLSRPGD